MSSNTQEGEIKKKSDNRNKINLRNVRAAFEKNLIPDLNNQTYFKKEDGTCPSLLYTAFDNNAINLIVFLLEQGVDPNIVAPDRQPILLEILEGGWQGNEMELIEMLVNAGADINKRGVKLNDRYVSFVKAILKGNLKVAKFFIESGADLEPPCLFPNDCNGCNPLQIVVRDPKTIHLAHLLLDRGVDVNKFCKNGVSPLHWAIRYNDVKLTKRLLDLGIDVNWLSRTEFGKYSDSVLRSILKHGIDKYPSTGLHVAMQFGHAAAQFILNNELTDVNAVDPNNPWSVLHQVVSEGSSNFMDMLLNTNPDVNLVSGKTGEYKMAVEIEDNGRTKSEAREKFEKHIVKLRAVGFYLNERNLAAISGKKLESFYDECLQEVDLMKKDTISPECHVNFHGLLFMTDKELALCLESLDDRGILKAMLHEKFPLYAGMIKYKLKKAHQWVKLRKELHTAIFNLFNDHLPSPVEEHVFSYFSMKELVKLRQLRWKEEEKLF